MQRKTAILISVLVLMVIIVASSVALVAGNRQDENPSPTVTAPSERGTSQEDTEGLGNGAVVDAVETTEVEIEDYAYKPATIKVKVGQTVSWTNKDAMRHDVVSDAGIENGPKSELLAKGESYTFTFTKAGTYTYYCSPHPYMKGTVIVED